MNEDLNKKIKQIADMLGQDSVPDNVKSLLSVLASSMGGGGESSPKSNEPSSAKVNHAGTNELEENMEMIRKVKKVMDRINNHNDPRISLLTSLKPFMSNSRQKKILNCINLLKMSSLVKLANDQDIGLF